MYIAGRHRSGETYPSPPNAALVAAANRYLIDPSPPGSPSAFAVALPGFRVVAAVNVVRRASGIFILSTQMSALLASADTQSWSAVLLGGATCTGGIADGSWLLNIASTITPSAPTSSSLMSLDLFQSSAGNLQQTMSMVGANASPAPVGASTIIIAAATIGGAQITPGQFFGVVYELP